MCFEANKDVDELLIQLKYETGGDALDMEEIA